MGRKADAKFTSLWEAYETVRAERVSRESAAALPAAEVWLKDALTQAGSDAVHAVLDLLKAERKALRRLMKHVRGRQDEEAAKASSIAPAPALDGPKAAGTVKTSSADEGSSTSGTAKKARAGTAAKAAVTEKAKPARPATAAKAKAGPSAPKSAAKALGEPKPAPRRNAQRPRDAAQTRPARRPRATPTET